MSLINDILSRWFVPRRSTIVSRQRVKRGLFRASNGREYNADLNGSLNILRKVVGDSVFDGELIERLVVSPVKVKSYKAS